MFLNRRSETNVCNHSAAGGGTVSRCSKVAALIAVPGTLVCVCPFKANVQWAAAWDSFVTNSLCFLEFRNLNRHGGGRDSLISDQGLQGKFGWTLRGWKQRFSGGHLLGDPAGVCAMQP